MVKLSFKLGLNVNVAKKELSKHAQNKWVILALLALAFFMVVLDVTIVNVALPSLARELNFAANNLQWVITAYSITFGGFLLLGGRMADLFGRREIFMWSVSFFAAASLLCGLAQSELWLIITRGIQGLAAAFMTPTALSIVLTEFEEGKERNKALGVWSAVTASGAAVGVLLGGILTEYLGWRWNFFVNVPVAALVVLSAAYLLPRQIGEENKKVKLDSFGALAATGGLMALVYALSRVPVSGWGSKSVLVFLSISVVLLAIFWRDEARSKQPLLPLALFKSRNVSGGNCIALIIAASMFAMFFFMTLYVQTILGYSPIKAGASFLIVPFIIALSAGLASQLVSRIGYKPLLLIGPFLLSVGLFINSQIVKVGGDYWHNLAPGLIVSAIGMGLSFVPLTLAATSGVPHRYSGLVSGVLNTAQQIGGAIGLAILSAVANSVTIAAVTAGKSVPEARVAGFQSGFYIGVVFAIAAMLVAGAVLRDPNLQKR
ncbi:MFS transporter [Candidatus Saccharibacteria bacterium]|nr:MFS transporter [Candidatus Saccharibacteria bacterium]